MAGDHAALDEAAARVLGFLQQAGAPKVHELPVDQARAVFEAMAPQLERPPTNYDLRWKPGSIFRLLCSWPWPKAPQ